MKVHVNEGCIGCELCVGICPSYFRMTEEGVAEAVTEGLQENDSQVIEARDSCPVGAIEVE